jgi:hypothetical protein
MKNRLSKNQLYMFIYVSLFLGIILSPFWLWLVKSEKELDVLVVDKTVPDQSYREHKGLVWILNNEKYIKNNGASYLFEKDYAGFHPQSNKEYEIKPIPNDLDPYEVIYLADQYGVYEEEFFGSNLLGKRSKSLYGGLLEEEASQIEQTLLGGLGKTLIAEFNTFASPTAESVKSKVENLLHINWNGWIGRYFSHLENTEVPVWVKENYEDEWDFKGSGFVFVNKDDFIVVLDEKEIRGTGALFELTKNGQRFFDEDLSAHYSYWFDIVSARNEDEILATYTLSVTDKAKEKLSNYGIPVTFPAIVQQKNAKYTSYYFAGDFADEGEVPTIYQTSGFTYWKQKFSLNDSFYWKVYVPVMKKILKEGLHVQQENEAVEITDVDGTKINSQTSEEYIQVLKNGKWENLLVKGVNMGIAKPAHFPGETAITKEEYFRWFQAIGDMNANAVRVYTIHPPAFYEAFTEYNKLAEEPLFLIHGAWVNEEMLVESQDAFNTEVTDDFKREIRQMIDIVHGNADIAPNPGHASGKYIHDISPYVLSFMIGIEWDPEVVMTTNEKHKGMPSFSGEYFQSINSSPFESWLASIMEYTTAYESKNYQWQHSMSFTNWVTTDLLAHPAEPSVKEDIATVNPMNIQATSHFKGGMFASYHIYPYYPDFLNFEEKYTQYVDKFGEKNNYAGYLNDLRKEHDMPIIVAEFGVPASRGLTHKNVYDMDQGFHSEEEQGEINAKLFRSIVSERYAGGLVFTWQDEWFKRTWNTMDYDNPDRRPFWTNLQTNEQHFGLLSFEPGLNEGTIFVDGRTADWNKQRVQALDVSSEDGKINKVFFTSDEGYLYSRIDFNEPINREELTTYLLVDTIQDQGQTKIPIGDHQTVQTDFGVDFVAEIGKDEHSRLWIDSYYDTFYFHYGDQLQMIPRIPYASQKDNGVFHPIRLALNKELTIPSTNETIPFQSYETGKFLFGNANPNDKEYDSLADIHISTDKQTIEIRIPWMLLNVKDPSQKEVMGDIWKEGLSASHVVEGFRVAVVAAGTEGVIGSLPALTDNHIKKIDTKLYSWDMWETPRYHERLKKSYYMMKEIFASEALKGEEG